MLPAMLPDLAELGDFASISRSGPVDVAAHRKLAEGSQVKGLFFRALLAQLPSDRQPSPPRRYLPFRAYPMPDYIDLLVHAAESLHPGRSLREGLLALGELGYVAFADSLVGRVMMGVLGTDLERVLERAPKAYGVSVEPGVVTSRRLAPQHWRIGFQQIPNFIDSYQVGVVEGAIRHHGGEPEVRAHLLAPDVGVLDVKWTERR